MSVGHEGEGEVTQSGGEVTLGDVDLGKLSGAFGTYQLSGDASLAVDSRLYVGRTGDGRLGLDGGTLAADRLSVGQYSGTGDLAITDATANVTIGKELTLGRNASFFAEPVSVINMARSADGTTAAKFDNRSTNATGLSGLSNLELSFECEADLVGTLEVAGSDQNVAESGFSANFSLGTLSVGTSETPASVQLVDMWDNGNRGSSGEAEALYVCKIALSAGSRLDLNGMKVYYRSLVDDGGVILLSDGALAQVGLDYDHNGRVDLADLAELQTCFSGSHDSPGYIVPFWMCVQTFDQDCDGDIDSVDLATFVQSCVGPAPD